MRIKDISSKKLKTPIKLQKYIDGKNEDNIPCKVLDTEIDKRAWVIPANSLTLKRQEFLQGQGINVKESIEFIVRYEDIDTEYKVLFKNNTYEIKSIEDVELKRKFLLLLAERVF